MLIAGKPQCMQRQLIPAATITIKPRVNPSLPGRLSASPARRRADDAALASEVEAPRRDFSIKDVKRRPWLVTTPRPPIALQRSWTLLQPARKSRRNADATPASVVRRSRVFYPTATRPRMRYTAIEMV